MDKLAEFRAQFPQYNDVPDGELLGLLHKKFYAATPLEEFHRQVGFTPEPVTEVAVPEVVEPEPEKGGLRRTAEFVGARLGRGVLEPAAQFLESFQTFNAGQAANRELVGLPPLRDAGRTAANLRARSELLEEISPKAEGGLARIGGHILEDIPSLLGGEALVLAAAPKKLLDLLKVGQGMSRTARTGRRAARGGLSGAGFSVASGEAFDDLGEAAMTTLTFALLDPAFGALGDVAKGTIRDAIKSFRAARRPIVQEELVEVVNAELKRLGPGATVTPAPGTAERAAQEEGAAFARSEGSRLRGERLADEGAEFAEGLSVDARRDALRGIRERPAVERVSPADEALTGGRFSSEQRARLSELGRRSERPSLGSRGERLSPESDLGLSGEQRARLGELGQRMDLPPLGSLEERLAPEADLGLSSNVKDRLRQLGQRSERPSLGSLLDRTNPEANVGELLEGRISPEVKARLRGRGGGGYVLPEVAFAGGRAAVGGAIGAPVGAIANEDDRLAGALAGFGLGAAAAVGPRAVARGAGTLAGRAANVAERSLPAHSQRIQAQIGGLEAEATGRSFGELVEDAYTALVKGTQPLKSIDRKLSPDRVVAPEQSVYAAGRATQGSARRAESFMTFGPRRYEGGNWVETNAPGLQEVSELAAGDIGALSRYQLAKRTLEVQRRGIETGISPADAILETSNTALEKAHRAAVEFDDGILQYWADAGGASPEALAAMRELGKDYVHLGRVFEGGTAPGTQAGGVSQQLQKLKGSTRQIKDPWLSRIDRTTRMVRAADRQRVGLNLIELAEANPGQSLVKRVTGGKRGVLNQEAQRIREAAAKNGIELTDEVSAELAEAMSGSALSKENTISVWRNGQRETWEIDPRMALGLQGLGPREVSWFSRLMGAPVGLFKGGTTLDPGFAEFNMFRDSFDANIQSKFGFKLGFDSFRGFHESVRANWLGKPRKVYEDFVASGGGFSNLRTGASTSSPLDRFFGGSESGAQRFSDQLVGKTGPIEMARHPIEALKKFTMPFEEAARIAEFKRAKEAGASDIVGFMAQQDVTVNFQEMGTAMAGLNMQVPFLNPAIQGLDRTAKTLGDPLVGMARGRDGAAKEAARVYGTAITTLTIPSILLWFANKDDQEIQDIRKTTGGSLNWYFRTPGGNIMRRPKPFIYGQIFATGAEAVLDKMFEDDPEAMNRWGEAVMEQSVMSSLPMWAQIPSDLRSNESAFFGTPIVPRGREEASPRLQTGPNTSGIANKLASTALGEMLNVSPARLEFVYGAVAGTLGRNILKTADLAVDAVTGETRALEPADIPEFSRFFARTATTNKEPVRTFYDTFDKIERLNTSYNIDREEDPGSVNERYTQEDRQQLALLPMFRAAARQIKTERDNLSQILDSNIKGKIKQKHKKAISDRIVAITRQVNEAVRRMESR